MTTSTLIGYKAASDLASKLSFFAIVVIAARLLPREGFGLFSLAVTLGWILSVAADFGLQLHVAREVARRPGEARAILGPLVRVRLGLTALAVATAIPVSMAIGGDSAPAFFSIVAAQLLSSLVEFLNHLYRGLSRSDVESSLNLVQRLVTLVAAMALLAWHPSLATLAIALVVPAAATLAVSARLARRLSPAGVERVQADGGAVRRGLARDVAPIGAGILLSALYFRIDLFLVEWWAGLDAVAAYNAAFRLVEALRLFPAAVLAVVFPMLCRTRSLRPLGVVGAGLSAFGLGVAGVTWALAPWIVRGFYGEAYAEAMPALRVLALAVPFFFLNYALTHQLLGWDAQASYARVSAAALGANLLLNALLLPRLGLTGAAWATVATEVVVAAGCALGLIMAQPRRAVVPVAAEAVR
jgi:O-antigen/teichoic acid export membrane protein